MAVVAVVATVATMLLTPNICIPGYVEVHSLHAIGVLDICVHDFCVSCTRVQSCHLVGIAYSYRPCCKATTKKPPDSSFQSAAMGMNVEWVRHIYKQ